MPEVTCPYCAEAALLTRRGHAGVPGRPDAPIWLCRPCLAWAGVHASSPSHRPLGRLANRELRRLQFDARVAFDSLWRDGDEDTRMRRGEAHRWLTYHLEVANERAHVGALDEHECRKLIRLVAERRTAKGVA